MSIVVTYPMLDVPVEDGPDIMVPDVSGAAFVIRETELLFNAYFGPASPTYQRWLSMQALGGGQFVVSAHGLPEPSGPSFRTWAADPANRNKVKYWRIEGTRVDPELGVVPVNSVQEIRTPPPDEARVDKPWTVRGMTITKATPTIGSECGALREADL